MTASVETVFNLWTALEMLNAPESSKAQTDGVVMDIAAAQALMPWQEASASAADRYIFQGGVCDASSLYAMLLNSLSEQEHEALPQGRKTRLFDLMLDKDGMPVPSSFELSLSAWAIGYLHQTQGDLATLLQGGGRNGQLPRSLDGGFSSGFIGFDEVASTLRQWVADQEQVMRESRCCADAAWLVELTDLTERVLGLELPPDVRERMLCRVQAQEDDGSEHQSILGSFFVQDLKLLAAQARQKNGLGKALCEFIGVRGLQKERMDVRDVEANDRLEALLHPGAMPAGRWPSQHSLVFSQQLAVNAAWAKLKNDAGLFAVNGPPGTGKTTMLRDVIAAVVTERAAVLAKLGSQVFTSKQATRIGDTWVPYYGLDSQMQGFSIVVASSNNGAVENITKELPERNAVPSSIPTSYFPEIAQNLLGQPAWGLLAAALGKRSNRTAFLNNFWWGTKRKQKHGVQGMREHLKSIIEEQAESGVSQEGWQLALARFRQAQKEEAQERAEAAQMAERPALIAEMASRKALLASRIAGLDAQEDEAHAKIESLSFLMGEQQGMVSASERLTGSLQQALQKKQGQKPGFWGNLLSLGKQKKNWKAESRVLQARLDACKQDKANLQTVIQETQEAQDAELRKHKSIIRRQQRAQTELVQTQAQLQQEENALQEEKLRLGNRWVDAWAAHEERERQQPWGVQAWLRARESLFLAALDLHKAFIEAHPAQFIANIQLAGDWLNGKPLAGDLARTALESLCMVVPVISSTFASMPRMFARLGQESIGWLLVDEAGQAVPSHAAGALWRARRAVIVGDPLQLEPVLALPGQVEAAIAAVLQAPTRLWPSAASAQTLADQAVSLGTWMPNQQGEQSWVGCPLRLHRRCDEPMFSVSNAVAYGGQMVNGKPAAHSDLPASHWLDVAGGTAVGHWIKEEGLALEKLLGELLHQHKVSPSEIAMISPFREAASHLRAVGRKFGLDSKKIGTVHTAQGKEADVVILVLGGAPALPGAKAWAAAKPNLLNVAVSRAKKRIFVLGFHEAWSFLAFFDVLSRHLPVICASKRG